MSLFRYSGNKTRLLKHLPVPPPSTRLFVEPFAGSLAYSMYYAPTLGADVCAAEANPLVRGLWEWLRTDAFVQNLDILEGLRAQKKVDAREWGERFGLIEPEITLLRLMTSGVYVGQLSSWVLYPQHSLDLGRLKLALPFLKAHLFPLAHDFQAQELVFATTIPNVFFFVDPPYLDTSANYKAVGKDHGGLNIEAVTSMVRYLISCKIPLLFTYGDGAPDVFGSLGSWEIAVKRKVPMIRTGGTRERTEWFLRSGF